MYTLLCRPTPSNKCCLFFLKSRKLNFYQIKNFNKTFRLHIMDIFRKLTALTFLWIFTHRKLYNFDMILLCSPL